MPSKENMKTEHGIWVVVGRKGESKEKSASEVPLLAHILVVQSIPNMTFIALLQYPPPYKVLRAIHAQLSSEIAFADAVETLHGALESFALAPEKVVKESLISPQEREHERQKDWKQRRKVAAGVAVDIWMYQLEELLL